MLFISTTLPHYWLAVFMFYHIPLAGCLYTLTIHNWLTDYVHRNYIIQLLYGNFHIIPHINLRDPYQPQVWVQDWYGVWYENCHIIIYLSYIFLSDKFAYLISYAESKARLQSAPNVVICFFLPMLQKSGITHVTHYHTFCAPQVICA